MTRLVFVYGSLMKGLHNHGLLSGARPLGTDRTQHPLYRLIDLGTFPAAIAGDDHIRGELYRIDDATFERLDALEGYPDLYGRRRVRLESGRSAWMYTGGARIESRAADSPEVPEGDWRAYLKSRSREEVA